MNPDPFRSSKAVAARRARLGRLGEAAACEELARLGYTIRARNYRCRRGEADVVAEEGEDLVFVEVKTRAQFDYGLPQDAVRWTKQQRLGRAALHYCDRYRVEDRPVRFDVVEVVILGNDVAGVSVIRDAFTPDV
jgi:putative endonuclease